MSNKFIDMLNATHNWPCVYCLKVVVPAAKTRELETRFLGFKFTRRPSKSGKYFSYSISANARSANQVISFYDRAKEIDGAIVL